MQHGYQHLPHGDILRKLDTYKKVSVEEFVSQLPKQDFLHDWSELDKIVWKGLSLENGNEAVVRVDAYFNMMGFTCNLNTQRHLVRSHVQNVKNGLTAYEEKDSHIRGNDFLLTPDGHKLLILNPIDIIKRGKDTSRIYMTIQCLKKLFTLVKTVKCRHLLDHLIETEEQCELYKVYESIFARANNEYVLEIHEQLKRVTEERDRAFDTNEVLVARCNALEQKLVDVPNDRDRLLQTKNRPISLDQLHELWEFQEGHNIIMRRHEMSFLRKRMDYVEEDKAQLIMELDAHKKTQKTLQKRFTLLEDKNFSLCHDRDLAVQRLLVVQSKRALENALSKRSIDAQSCMKEKAAMDQTICTAQRNVKEKTRCVASLKRTLVCRKAMYTISRRAMVKELYKSNVLCVRLRKKVGRIPVHRAESFCLIGSTLQDGKRYVFPIRRQEANLLASLPNTTKIFGFRKQANSRYTWGDICPMLVSRGLTKFKTTSDACGQMRAAYLLTEGVTFKFVAKCFKLGNP